MTGWLVTCGRWKLTFPCIYIFQVQWPVAGWPVTSNWPTCTTICNAHLTGDRSVMSSCLVGKWPVVGWPVTGGWWTYTPLGTSTLRVATLIGLPLGSRAMWGSVPINFSFVWWIRHGLRSLLLLRHNPLSRSVSSSFLGKLPGSVCPGTARITSWFPGTTRTFMAFVMIIPVWFYMTTFTTHNSHESCENSLRRTSEG